METCKHLLFVLLCPAYSVIFEWWCLCASAVTFAGLDDKVRGRKQEVNIQPSYDKSASVKVWKIFFNLVQTADREINSTRSNALLLFLNVLFLPPNAHPGFF